MADDPNNSGGGNNGGSTTPPAGGGGPDPNQPPAGGGGNDNGGGTGTNRVEDLPDWAQRQIREANNEAQNIRKRLRDLEKADEDRKAAQMSDLEKAQKAATDADAKAKTAQERILRSEIKLAAAKVGIVDPDAAYALLDKSKVEVDDNGEATNLDTLIADLAKNKPYLVGTSGGTSGASGGSASNPGRQRGGQTLTRDDIAKMTPDQINARWAEVQTVLSGK